MLVGSTSCKKSLLDVQSQSAYSVETYFNNSDALNQATIATYATLLHNGLWSREYYFIFDLLSYEAKKTTNMQGDLAQLADYTFGTNQTQLGQLWSSLYRMTFRANVVLDRIEKWKPTEQSDIQRTKQYAAEVRFLRAYAYFNLVSLWNDVPLITSYDSTIANNYASRTPAATVWSFVEQELTAAAPDLPVKYGDADLGRITQGAALAMLGRVYMYEKKWVDAQTTLQKLTQAPFSYSLDPDYNNLFSTTNQNSPENIFQIMNAPWTDWGIGNQYYVFGGQETWGGKATHSDRAQEYGFNDWNNVYISNAAVKAFTYANPANGQAGYIDPRAKFTFYGSAESGGATVYCEKCVEGVQPFPFDATDPQGDYKWKKYEYYNEVKTFTGPQSAINGQVIRYADVLLMLAECYIQQGNAGTQPLGLINSVRGRSKAVLYSSLGTQSNALSILTRERQLELCGEQSRYFDLMRWGIAKQTINAERKAEPKDGTTPFQDKNVWFPIPDIEKNYNPNVAKDVKDNWN